ncbi:hypothetical protein Ga0080559_TMP3724 [Salipiger profundus]|uniref:Uncharacterized protein n=1 Tax=Salipiger profundus TaxID=1229727 RepID=A0A1U7D8Y0_9RHOB|nr:hypothetical protein Ga0080559_TMP3724 [Salipiger profundus]
MTRGQRMPGDNARCPLQARGAAGRAVCAMSARAGMAGTVGSESDFGWGGCSPCAGSMACVERRSVRSLVNRNTLDNRSCRGVRYSKVTAPGSLTDSTQSHN